MKGIINHDLFTSDGKTGEQVVILKGTEVEIMSKYSLFNKFCYKIQIQTSNKFCHVTADLVDLV